MTPIANNTHHSEVSLGPNEHVRIEVPDDLRPRTPRQISKKGWIRVLKRFYDQVINERLDLIAAGVAFYLVLSILPGLAVAVSIYGMFASPTDVIGLVRATPSWIPTDAVRLMSEQLTRITEQPPTTLSLSALFALLVSIWSANRGTKALIAGLNVAYGEQEKRNFFVLNGISLPMTAGLVTTLIVAVTFIARAPDFSTMPMPMASIARVASWIVFAAFSMLVLATLYRYGPSRRRPRWQWVSFGAMLATVGWLVGSAGFSYYVESFAGYNKTFGTLAGVVVTMTWLWLTAFLVLLGACLDAEMEHETLADSTVGDPQPLGERGAYVADDVPPRVMDALQRAVD